MATVKQATKTFAGLRCLHCGEIDSLSVRLETLAVQCECGEEVTKAEVEAMVAQWSKLWAWLDTAK